jgi:hypothetical protein
VRIVLAKAIDAAEERVPKRIPWARRAAPTPPLEEEVEEEEEVEPPADEGSPPAEPTGPRKRLTVPVGALDAEPEPSLLEQRPPEQRRPELTPESLFPTAADLQAVTPPAPPAAPAAPPPVEAPFVAPPLPTSESAGSVVTPMQPPGLVEPPRIETVPFLPETPPPLPPTPDASEPKLRVSHELVIDPSVTLPSPSTPAPPPWTPAAEPRPEAPALSRPSRPSRPQPRLSHVAVAPPRRPRPAPRWLWPVIGGAVVLGGVGALLWFGVIPLDRLRNLLPKKEPEPVEARTEPRRPVQPRPDVAAAPGAPSVERRPPAPPPAPPTQPPGVVLSGVVYVVVGLAVESVEEISPENRPGFRIQQLLASGQRIILEEFPADTTVEGEIGVTGLPGDTVVGHVRIGGVDVTLKGVIPEALVVEMLQQLVQVRP